MSVRICKNINTARDRKNNFATERTNQCEPQVQLFVKLFSDDDAVIMGLDCGDEDG